MTDATISECVPLRHVSTGEQELPEMMSRFDEGKMTLRLSLCSVTEHLLEE